MEGHGGLGIMTKNLKAHSAAPCERLLNDAWLWASVRPAVALARLSEVMCMTSVHHGGTTLLLTGGGQAQCYDEPHRAYQLCRALT